MRIIEPEVKINRRRLERRVSQSKNTPDWLNKVIDDCLEKSSPEPRGIYSFFSCYVKEDKIFLEDTIFNSPFLTDKFENITEAGLFIVTIGNELGKRTEEAFNNSQPLKGWVYDAIGSEYVESTAKALHKHLEKEKGYCMSRFSPGYNDWQLEEQKKLFSLIPGENIGVNLTEECIMLPEKSVSAIIGHSKKKEKGCKDCNQKDCPYRE